MSLYPLTEHEEQRLTMLECLFMQYGQKVFAQTELIRFRTLFRARLSPFAEAVADRIEVTHAAKVTLTDSKVDQYTYLIKHRVLDKFRARIPSL